VPIYRHWPGSRGIAERFVLTLKSRLRGGSWQSSAALEAWLEPFIREDNVRPQQGLVIPGLASLEFALTIWPVAMLMSKMALTKQSFAIFWSATTPIRLCEKWVY